MYFEKLLERVSEPADLAIFLLGFAIGYIIDSFYLTGSTPPGTIAGIVSIGFLGLKKSIDAYLSNSNWLRNKRMKKRLRILREYFSDNPGAIELIDGLNKILHARLIDHVSFEHLLDEQLREHIDNILNHSGYENLYSELTEKYNNQYRDFAKLHSLAQFPEKNQDELMNFWEELDDKYFGVVKRQQLIESSKRFELRIHDDIDI